MHDIDTVRILRYGAATLTVRTVYDEYPEYSWLGSFELRPSVTGYSYHRPSGLMLCPDGMWRNEHGRYAADPTDDYGRWARECEWIIPCVWKGEGLRQAYLSAKRLDRMDRGDWHFMGIVATVAIDEPGRWQPRVISDASLWGVESDSDDAYIRSIAREMARQALNEAQAFRSRLAKHPA